MQHNEMKYFLKIVTKYCINFPYAISLKYYFFEKYFSTHLFIFT